MRLNTIPHELGPWLLVVGVAAISACGGITTDTRDRPPNSGAGGDSAGSGGTSGSGGSTAGSGGTADGGGVTGGSGGTAAGSGGATGGLGGNAGSGGATGGLGGSSGSAGAAAAGGVGNAAGTAPVCDTPLDEATLPSLSITPLMTQVIQLRPGDAYEFTFFLLECCYFATPIETCTEWSVTPAEGVSLDPESGLLAVDWDTPGGTMYTVTGDIEGGRHVDSVDVYVVTRATHPVIGTWTEEARYDCQTGAEVPADPAPIGEVTLSADGSFTVTWMPFEVYVDYWGTYVIDLAAGTIEMTIENGNYFPDDADLSGSFYIDSSGRLVLRDFWFGSDYGSTATPACGHRLTGGYVWE